jgi:hypothetical protein
MIKKLLELALVKKIIDLWRGRDRNKPQDPSTP